MQSFLKYKKKQSTIKRQIKQQEKKDIHRFEN